MGIFNKESIIAEFDEQIKQINASIGGISNTNGFFAEEYFFNSFEIAERKRKTVGFR
jgi:hypothetical protein